MWRASSPTTARSTPLYSFYAQLGISFQTQQLACPANSYCNQGVTAPSTCSVCTAASRSACNSSNNIVHRTLSVPGVHGPRVKRGLHKCWQRLRQVSVGVHLGLRTLASAARARQTAGATTTCPNNVLSNPLSYKQNECLCEPGYFGNGSASGFHATCATLGSAVLEATPTSPSRAHRTSRRLSAHIPQATRAASAYQVTSAPATTAARCMPRARILLLDLHQRTAQRLPSKFACTSGLQQRICVPVRVQLGVLRPARLPMRSEPSEFVLRGR